MIFKIPYLGNPDRYYNSLCFLNPHGELIETYQKTHLYSTDESWAEEGPGFKSINVPSLGKVCFFKSLIHLLYHLKIMLNHSTSFKRSGLAYAWISIRINSK